MTRTNLNLTTLSILDGSVRYILAGFLDERKAEGKSAHTLRYYQVELNPFVDWLDGVGMVYLAELTPNIIRRYLLELGERRNPGGVHASYRAIRAMLNWYEFEYEPEGWSNPIRKVKVSGGKCEPLPGVSLESVQQLLETCTGNAPIALRDRAILLGLLDTGARASEFVALNISDLEYHTGRIIIQHGKGDKRRVVFLGTEARKAMRRYLKARGTLPADAPLIATDEGTRLTYAGLRQIARRRALLANVPVPGLHDFRRCCAITMHRNGASLAIISEYLGHSSLSVTMRYIRLNDNDLRQAHRATSPADSLTGIKGKSSE